MPSLLASVLLIGSLVSCAARLSVAELRCENQQNPLGIDAVRPCLSWLLKSTGREQTQTAYQVLAASVPERLAEGKCDLWDSGKVVAQESIGIVYGGKTLDSTERVFWKVRVWDATGKASAWSKAAWFEMGLLRSNDWHGVWVRRNQQQPRTEAQMFQDDPAPLFRKELVIGQPVQSARMYITGLGYYELLLNGKRVGDHLIDPGWTDYRKRVLYSTYDVTRQLRKGTNAIGVMLGNGWFNPLPLKMWGHVNPRDALETGEPRLIAELRITYANGVTEVVATDPSWKTAPGPVIRNSVYLGEVYDARKESPGWGRPGFDDSRWEHAVKASEEVGVLRAQDAPPIRVTRVLRAVKRTALSTVAVRSASGVTIFDFGQNFAGWARLHINGAAGTRVRMRYGELLYPDGTLNGMTSVAGQIKGGGKDYRDDGRGAPRTAFQEDHYILRGDGEEIYTPRFTFHGFRYVEVTTEPGDARCEFSVEGLRLNADVATAGTFECSNPMFNRIQEMVLWTELSNLFSVESDCPHREKFGYGGDIVAACEMAMLNFDMSRFYRKSAEDLGDAQRGNGGFTETSPYVGISDEGLGEGAGPIGWGTAQPLLVWELYRYYGDRRLLEEQFAATQRWIELLNARANDGILDNGISDHESLVPKPRALTGTAFYYWNLELFGRIARVIGRLAEAEQAEAIAQNVKDAVNHRFLRTGSGVYDSGSQACQAFALCLGLVPVDEKTNAIQVLLKDIESHGNHLTTGIFGTRFMLDALSANGQANAAYQIVNQKTFPGWGWMLENGATTLWEHWEFSDNTFSHNHPMFGSVSEWFYKSVAGIAPAEDAVGFNHVVIAPKLVNQLEWAKASYNSVRGRIETEWRREKETLRLKVHIPVGARATVKLPTDGLEKVSEGGKAVNRAGAQLKASMVNRYAELEIGSGDYDFLAKMPKSK